jgi:hypothetical protein
MKNLCFLLLITSLSLFIQCKKDGFPSITMSGENTFGCRVNGEDWTPKKNPNNTGVLASDSPIDARYGQVTGILAIKAIHYYSSTDRETIKVTIFSPEEGETYILDAIGSSPLIGFDCNEYQIDTSATAIVTINKFDETDKIVSGTFEYTAIGQNGCSNTVEITDGRFDLVYRL